MTAIWKPDPTTPQEPEEEPELAPKMRGDCRQMASQISRVKQAWQATRKLSLRIENLETIENITYRARNHIIDQQSLRRFKAQFWERYKTVYPADAYPSDRLLYRCHNEMEDRLLTNYDIRRARTAANQIKATKGGPLAIHGSVHSIKDHMAKLRIYLLAIAIIGTDKVQGAPPAEEFGSDSTSS